MALASMGVGAAALLVGVATGFITLGHQNQSATGDHISYSGVVTGLTYTSMVVSTVPNPAPAASTGTTSLQQLLVGGANDFCAVKCTVGNRSVVVTYSFTTSLAGAIQITVQVTASAGSGTANLYLRQLILPTSGTIVIVWDVGTAVSLLTDVKVTIHQCGLLSCP
ncbi:MAG: hypothetical protein L3K23_06910 [Thermoplasmata archaeon]|nr:hypothetical protein [Thermoplasmata archaeon]